MKDTALEKYKETVSEVLYRQLKGVDKSDELADEYLQLKVGKKRLTSNQCRKISNYYAECIVEKLQNMKKKSGFSSATKNKMTKDCLDVAFERFDDE